MEKVLMAQGLKNFWLYKVDIIKGEYLTAYFKEFKGKINFYKVPIDESESETKPKKKKKEQLYHTYLEIDKTPEIENYLKKNPVIGCVFEDSLNKNSGYVCQVFNLEQEDCPNDKKIYFGASTYRSKIALSTSLKNMTFEDFIIKLKENPLYIIDRY